MEKNGCLSIKTINSSATNFRRADASPRSLLHAELFLSVLLLLCGFGMAQTNSPATAPASTSSVELVLKQPPPSASSPTVLWSPNEQFAAFSSYRSKTSQSNFWTPLSELIGIDLIVYDLNSGLEARRIYLPFLTERYGFYQFSYDSQFFFLTDGERVQRCALVSAAPCDTFTIPKGQNAYSVTARGDLVYTTSLSSTHILNEIGSDPIRRRELSKAEMKQPMLPFINGSFSDNYKRKQYFPVSPTPSGEPIDIWTSPKRDSQLYTAYDPARHFLLFGKTRGEKGQPASTVLLAAESDQVNRLEFSRADASLVTDAYSVNHWRFYDGREETLPSYPIFSADGKSAVFFDWEATSKTYVLKKQTFIDNKTVLLPVRSPRRTDWIGTSFNGDFVAHPGSGIEVFHGSETIRVTCHRPPSVGVPNYIDPDSGTPNIDPTGHFLFAICQRNSKPTLVVWSLDGVVQVKEGPRFHSSISEVAVLPVDNYDDRPVMGFGGDAVILVGSNALHIYQLRGGRPEELVIGLVGGEYLLDPEIQADGHTLQFAINDPANNIYTLGRLDLTQNGQLTKTPYKPGRATHMVTNFQGWTAVVDNRSVISVFDPQGNRIYRLVTFTQNDWLAVAEDGRFDGTSGALKWAGLRSKATAVGQPLERLFNELYTPGLLSEVVFAAKPASTVPRSLFLELPQTEMLLRTGMTAKIIDDRAAVCFPNDELRDALARRSGVRATSFVSNPSCRAGLYLQDQSSPMTVVKQLNDLKQARPVTAWDDQKILEVPHTLHIMTVAVGKYIHAGFQSIPGAATDAGALEYEFAKRSGAANVVRWSEERCDKPLVDGGATKQRISECIGHLVDAAKPEDEVVLIFSGHGGTKRDGPFDSELFNFFPADYDPVSSTTDEAISTAEFANVLRFLKARRIVVVMDACESGAIMVPMERALVNEFKFRAMMTSQTGARDSAPQGALLLAASSGIEDSVVSTSSPFTGAILSVLQSPDQALHWAHSASAQLQQPLRVSMGGGQMSVQHPLAEAIGADFELTGHQ